MEERDDYPIIPQTKGSEDLDLKLLPCPFCNTQPEWINEALPDSHFYIRCPHCHIVMKEDRRDKVIGMWNRREELASLKEENAKLREQVKAKDYLLDRLISFQLENIQ